MEDTPKRKRGRPPKPKEDKPKRPRGRPRKDPAEKERAAREREQRAREEKERQEREALSRAGLLRNEKGNFLPANCIQTDEEMDETNLVALQNSRVYSKELDTGEKVGAIVHNITDEVTKIGRRVELRDVDVVKDTTIRYLRSCERTGLLPSQRGLARALGVCVDGMKKFIARHPEHPTTDFLMLTFDAFSEAVSQASLSGSVHPIFAMFLLKSVYGIRENDPVVKPTDKPLNDARETKDVLKKYLPSYDDK